MKELNNINKELKIYINESSFISNKCRNKILKYFMEEFNINLDIGNYQNVDLEINEQFKIIYREDIYTSNDEIKTLSDVNERYERFKEKADKLLKNKKIDFDNMSNMNNISNLIIVICMILVAIIVIVLGIVAFFNGHYFDCLWFLIVIIPSIVPQFRENLRVRFTQAKKFIRKKIKK